MAKKKIEESEDSKQEDDDIIDLDFEEDFEDDLDLEEELELFGGENLRTELESKEKIIDKDEEQKQLYLSCGIHIGTKLLSGDARRYIYRQTNYGLYVINLEETDRRIKIAAKFLSKYVEEGSDRVIVCSVRRYGKEPVKQFCD